MNAVDIAELVMAQTDGMSSEDAQQLLDEVISELHMRRDALQEDAE